MQIERWMCIDEQFVRFVTEKRFPKPHSETSLEQAGLHEAALLSLFDSQLKSRHLDLAARLLKQRNQSYYTIGSSGHEVNAAVALAFRPTDMAFLHYRSAAFMLQRAEAAQSNTMLRDILLSIVASSDDPVCSGRHKVFGSRELFVPPQTSTIASHLPKAVGSALAINTAKRLGVPALAPTDSVVLCSFGDASVNHSTAQGAFNVADWVRFTAQPLPLVFICEDNGLGISVPTPQGWLETAFANRPGLCYLKADGLSLLDTYQKACVAAHLARVKKKPVFLHLQMVRLMGHAGSDIEAHYLSDKTIESNEFNDPLLHSARDLYTLGILSPEAIVARYEAVREEVLAVAEAVSTRPKLRSAKAVMASIIPPNSRRRKPALPTQAQRKACFADSYAQLTVPRNLSQMLNFALTDILLQYDNTVIFGEDVGKKGGVYRVTAGLAKRFGRHRVFDTLLDEQTILGMAMGMGLNGLLPIPEIQFLAYVFNALDQIRGEAATLPFFSDGQFTNPMVIRIASLGYQKGFGGHFHNDNAFAALREIPGVVIACPSHGVDAVKMLRQCVHLAQREQRVVIFMEPIALYMTKDLLEKGDNAWLGVYPTLRETMAFGELGVRGSGRDLAIISYGNGYYLSCQAAHRLQVEQGIAVKCIDLRWLAPLNSEALLAELKGVERVLIVDESRKTGSLSEQLMTLLVERLSPLPQVRRVTGEDSFIPLGTSWEHVLPSTQGIIDAASLMVQEEISV